MEKEIKNLPEFRALIKRYQTITLEEIQSAFDGDGYDYDYDTSDLEQVKIRLTGFGKTRSCTLCSAISYHTGDSCGGCVYYHRVPGGGPVKCVGDETYDLINDAETPEELFRAYYVRSIYMETLIEE